MDNNSEQQSSSVELNQLKVIKEIISEKTALWKHSDSCLINCVSSCIKNFRYGVCFKLATVLLLGLFKPKSLLKQFMKLKTYKEIINFGIFLGGLTGSYKFLLWYFRSTLKSDKVSSFLAGMGSGWFVQLLSEKWRVSFAQVLFSRALFVALTKAHNDGVPCKIKHGEIAFSAAIVAFVIYITGYHREIVSQSLLNLLFKWTFETKNEYIFKYCWAWKVDYQRLLRQGKQNEFDLLKEYNSVVNLYK